MTTTRVLVGLDGSEGSRRALQWCIDHAGPLDAEVVAVHALSLPVVVVPDRAMPSLLVESDAVFHERVEKNLEQWCEPLRDAGTRTGRAPPTVTRPRCSMT